MDVYQEMHTETQLSSYQIGKITEQDAGYYLIQQGLKLMESNYSCDVGEIDLIMQDRDTRVFVEVRYRAQNEYGNALESVTPKKQRRIIRTTQYYLQQNNLFDKIPCRFDVLAWDFDPKKIQWIKDAFWVK